MVDAEVLALHCLELAPRQAVGECVADPFFSWGGHDLLVVLVVTTELLPCLHGVGARLPRELHDGFTGFRHVFAEDFWLLSFGRGGEDAGCGW